MDAPHKTEKNPKFGYLPLSTSGPLNCALTGAALLKSPYFNKGSAFPPDERKEFKLYGLLPQNVQTLEQQVARAYEQYSSRPSDIAKNTFMTSMKEQSEVLYYRLLHDNLKEMFSVIYTPTEGEAIENYSRLFRRPQGCFLNIDDQDRIDDNIKQWGDPDDIDVVVVSDGEQILGVGDQGSGAILISIAKLVLYTLCAGIHPSRTLPVVLDCGTDNKTLLEDDLYLGLRKSRIRGERYDSFVDQFVQAVRNRYPKAYIHFEDFGLANARRILDKYQPRIACFNDDVQGTGCVTLAAIMAAAHVSDIKLADLRIMIFGAGSAGMGISDQLRDVIAQEGSISREEASQHIWCVDKPGLLLTSDKKHLTEAQLTYARDDKEWENKERKDLASLVDEVKPHVLIGTSTNPRAFTEKVIRTMAKHVERPIIFPLSNPTKLHEARPEDLYKWTDGKALVATGSPFPPVEYDGEKLEIAECNNSTVFPGIGLGAVLCRTKLMPPSLLVAATKALAAQAPALKNPKAALLPDVTDVREISVQIARAVIKAAVKEGLAQVENIPESDDELEEWIREQMWDARYRSLKFVDPNEADSRARGELGIAASGRLAK
ncbi:hypothetical protein P152DRAFT_504985 [Eremomyces bilateralis CBS 781.70]|uniref:Malic enzyme n=1 Tax=Eremomyces bilateralis CBS 781.70 TaxID=1392243 RepID=A0A6G1GE40_9PEZI|nr:uncharacterized protein P152DRAFT_504985 [Eremomyces bilateralis CBS 781.70]KAF1816284.1 hypothetical protein P152DRAFT_504985 [Eremomyces bilateralis CBS 781.70]